MGNSSTSPVNVPGKGSNGEVYKDIVLDIIHRCHSLGLRVAVITSDMGSSNRAMWRAFGIHVTSVSRSHAVIHPCNVNWWLYFMADVPHLIKNLCAALLNGSIFLIGDRQISIRPVIALAEYQEHRVLKLAPKLKLDLLTKPSHFAKMKVANAMSIVSNSTAKGLEYMVDHDLMSPELKKEALDTSWFLDLMNRWFDIMSSRSPATALSNLKRENYDKAKKVLTDVIDIFQNIQIGRGGWKPVQTGIILSTLTVTSLATDLLDTDNIRYLLTARLTQDCLENLFSTLRLKNPIPTPIEFRNALKIVTIAQFLKTPKNTSYDKDDSLYLANYLEPVVDPEEPGKDLEEVIVISETQQNLDTTDRTTLYYLAGEIIYFSLYSAN